MLLRFTASHGGDWTPPADTSWLLLCLSSSMKKIGT
jgi:hypothetical protein